MSTRRQVLTQFVLSSGCRIEIGEWVNTPATGYDAGFKQSRQIVGIPWCSICWSENIEKFWCLPFSDFAVRTAFSTYRCSRLADLGHRFHGMVSWLIWFIFMIFSCSLVNLRDGFGRYYAAVGDENIFRTAHHFSWQWIFGSSKITLICVAVVHIFKIKYKSNPSAPSSKVVLKVRAVIELCGSLSGNDFEILDICKKSVRHALQVMIVDLETLFTLLYSRKRLENTWSSSAAAYHQRHQNRSGQWLFRSVYFMSFPPWLRYGGANAHCRRVAPASHHAVKAIKKAPGRKRFSPLIPR